MDFDIITAKNARKRYEKSEDRIIYEKAQKEIMTLIFEQSEFTTQCLYRNENLNLISKVRMQSWLDGLGYDAKASLFSKSILIKW